MPELVTNDYVLPNEALSKGEYRPERLPAQKPHLISRSKIAVTSAGAGRQHLVYPIAGYSKKIKIADELERGFRIALPNDPTNLGCSLPLLQKVGLIKLKDGAGLLPTVLT